jgi:hypothetical protein
VSSAPCVTPQKDRFLGTVAGVFPRGGPAPQGAPSLDKDLGDSVPSGTGMARSDTSRYRLSRVERRLYTWDAVHGHVEVFNLRGRHLAVLDAFTGTIIGEAMPGRRIDV